MTTQLPGWAPKRRPNKGPKGPEGWRRYATPSRLLIAFLAGVAYIPLLLTHRGMLSADTKIYLYLNSSKLLDRTGSLWDPHTGLGTVTHENIGYLWPMGPWYRVFAAFGVPTWIAQRFWIGTLLLLAGLGMRWLMRTLLWSGPGLGVASVAYMLSPYVLQYEARISAILMAWTALPWMLGLTIRAVRSGTWRHPALFALVAATAGSVNASSMIFAGLAAVLWLPFAIWGLGETDWRSGLITLAKMVGLSVLVALWWLAGLVTEGGHGLNILRYTESVRTVARTGLPFEALRGLGNWFFYGTDNVGPWVRPAVEYTHWGWLLAVSFALPVLAFAAAVMLRWRYKLYFAGLILVGVAFAVGVHPYRNPSPFGWLLKVFATNSTVGLALRSVGRAVPLVALGTAVLLGAGVDGLWRRLADPDAEDAVKRRRTRQAQGAAAAITVLAIANVAPLWLGQFVDNNLQAPNHIPSYWSQAAKFLDQGGNATRVLELPGADFSVYRWGATLDPVTPGISNRPFVGRQLQPAGGPGSANLLIALDRRLQEGVLDPQALAPLAREMSVGAVVLRSDLQYERYRTPRPRATWQIFDPPPVGLDPAIIFGPTVSETPVIPFTDEITLGTPPSAPNPRAVAVFPVEGAQPIIRTQRTTDPMVLAGDGEGMVDAAAAGLLDPNQPVIYAASIDGNPAALSQALSAGADLVVTDTNKLRAQRWGTVRDIYGYTEVPGEKPLVADTNDARLPLFSYKGTDAQTVAEERGVFDVVASGYGNSFAYSPAERPDQAMDGNLSTAWKVGAFANAVGQRLQVNLSKPVTTGEVTLVQPVPGGTPGTTRPKLAAGSRYITEVTITFDGKHPIERSLDLSSLTAQGERVTFPVRKFSRLEIRIDDTNLHHRDYRHDNGVGFAEVRIGPPQSAPLVDEVLRMPTDLLDRTGVASINHKLYLIMTRDRANPAEPFRADTEAALSRTFSLPAGRSFSIGGTARVSALAPDQLVDQWLGRSPGGAVTNSSGRLPGDLAARSSSALDGDPSTWWSPGFGPQVGNWISVNLPHPVDLSHWTMQIVADGQHSVPTRLQVQVDDGASYFVDLPPVRDQARPGSVVKVRVPVVGTAMSRLRVTIAAVRPVSTLDSISGLPHDLPVGIAELGLAGVLVSPAGSSVPATCQTNLLTVDGNPVGVRILGTTAAAADRQGSSLAVQACGPGVDATGALRLGPGPHVIRTTPGQQTGIDLDRLVLASAEGGAPLAVSAFSGGAGSSAGSPAGSSAGAPAGSAVPNPSSPSVRVVSQAPNSARIQVAGSRSPFWLVLGESLDKGWSARITGKGGHSLGRPQLINGYANGWLITPSSSSPLNITLSWTPQGSEITALWLSGLGALACVALALMAGGYALRSYPAPKAGRLPDRPTFFRPWRSFDPGLDVRRAAITVVVCGLVAWLLIGWLWGLVVAGVVLIGLRRGTWQTVPPAVAVAAVLLAGLFVTQQQLARNYRLSLDWPQHFNSVSGVTWAGVALLAADALVRHIQARRPRRQ